MISERARACKLCGALHRIFGDHCRQCKDLLEDPVPRGTVGLRDIRQSYVYAIGVAGDDSSCLKFGYTKQLEERLRTLQTGSPVKLGIVATDFGSKKHESAIHEYLSTDRLYGEWFERSGRAIEVIEAMRSGKVAEMFGLVNAKAANDKPILYVAEAGRVVSLK